MKYNLKLFIKILLASLVLFMGLFFLSITLPKKFSNPIIQSFRYINDVLNSPSKKITYLVLGDSTALRSFPSHMMRGQLSLANFMASPKEHYYTLRRYLSKQPAPSCILLADSYNWRHKEKKGFWNYFIANDFYTIDEIEKINATAERLGDQWAVNQSLLPLKIFYYRSGLANFDFVKTVKSLFGEKRGSHKKFYKSLKRNRGLLGSNKQMGDDYKEELTFLDGDFKASLVYDFYLKKLFELAESSGIKLYYIQTPISTSIWEKTKAQNYYQALHAHLETLQNGHYNLHFIKKIKIFSDFYFYDGNHVNQAGAEYFYSELEHELDCI